MYGNLSRLKQKCSENILHFVKEMWLFKSIITQIGYVSQACSKEL